MKILKILIILLGIFFTNVSLSQDFEVSPASLIFKADPFENTKQFINITNHSNKATMFSITYSDFIFNEDGNVEVVAANSTENTCSKWITPDNDVFEIKPNETFRLSVNLLVPEEDYKARWTYMYVQTSQEQTAFTADKDTRAAGVNLSARIAIEVIRKPKTQQPTNIEIVNLREEENPENQNSRTFSVFIDNQGSDIHECNVLFIASNLSNAEEHEFDRIKFKSFPGYKRKITFSLPNTLPSGEYSLVALLDYGEKSTLKGARLNKKLIINK